MHRGAQSLDLRRKEQFTTRHVLHQSTLTLKSTLSFFTYITLHALIDDDCTLHLGAKHNIQTVASTITSTFRASVSSYFVRGCYRCGLNVRKLVVVVDLSNGEEGVGAVSPLRTSIDASTQTYFGDTQGLHGERVYPYVDGVPGLAPSHSLYTLTIKLNDTSTLVKWQQTISLALWIHASKSKLALLSTNRTSLQTLDTSVLSMHATLKKIQGDRGREVGVFEARIRELEGKVRVMYSAEDVQEICEGYEDEIRGLNTAVEGLKEEVGELRGTKVKKGCVEKEDGCLMVYNDIIGLFIAV